MLDRVSHREYLRASLRLPEADRELKDAEARLAEASNIMAALSAKRAAMRIRLDVDTPINPRVGTKEDGEAKIRIFDRDEIAPAKAVEDAAHKVVAELRAKRVADARESLQEPIAAFGEAVATKLDELASLLALGIALDAEAGMEKVDLASPMIASAGTLMKLQIQHRALVERWRVRQG